MQQKSLKGYELTCNVYIYMLYLTDGDILLTKPLRI